MINLINVYWIISFEQSSKKGCCTSSHTSVIQGQSTRLSWRRATTGHGAAWDQQGVLV